MKTWIAILCVLFAVGCGSDTSNKGGSNGSTGSITEPSEIGPALWTELCDAVFSCPNVSPELVLILGRYASAAECRADFGSLDLDLEFGQVELAIAQGRAEFDSAAADICLQNIRASLCDGRGFESVPECEVVFIPKVEEGGNCAGSDECVAGLDCNEFESEECYGTCVPNCGNASCSDSEFCDTGDVCAARRPLGGMCNFDSMCDDGLTCDFDSQTCVATGTVPNGGACSRNQQCQPGLACRDSVCSGVSLVPAGEACTFGEDTQELCVPGSVCTDFTISVNGAQGTCGPPKGPGGACRVFFECQPGLTCSSVDPLVEGQCVDLYPNGAACSEPFDCESNNCSDGTCAAPSSEMICQIP